MKKIILPVCLILFAVTAILTVAVIPNNTDCVYYDYILHAGGVTSDGITGSNSLEALEHSYKRGYRTIELDFCFTEDEKLVCVHDFDAYYTKLREGGIFSDEFEEARCDTYEFTSLTLDHLATWLTKHKDVIIVTDIKERNAAGARLIAENYPELLDNFCFQIYDMRDYAEVHDLGFENIILTLYYMSWNEKMDTDAIVEFAKENKLAGITFDHTLADGVTEYVSKLLAADTPLFVHTVNDRNEQKRFFDMGISGVYTDYGMGD